MTGGPEWLRWSWTRSFRLETLRSALVAQLPAYARPVFLRIVPTLELTGTFKLRKSELAQQGYDPSQVSDAVFMEDALRAAYVPVDQTRFRGVIEGTLRI